MGSDCDHVWIIGVYIAFSRLCGVIVTDFIQFILAMFGTIMLAWYAVDFVAAWMVCRQSS